MENIEEKDGWYKFKKSLKVGARVAAAVAVLGLSPSPISSESPLLGSPERPAVEGWQAMGPFIRKKDGIRAVGTDGMMQICAGTWENGIWMSENGGRNWKQIVGVEKREEYGAPRQIKFYGAAAYIATDNGIVISKDGDAKFFPKPDLEFIQTLEFIDGKLFIGGLGGVFYSDIENFDDWQPTGINQIKNNEELPIMVRDIAHDKKNNIIYAAGWWDYSGWDNKQGAGVYKSNDFGVTWTEVNNGLTNLNVNSIFVNPEDPKIVLAGTEGAGVQETRAPDSNYPSLFITKNGGETWEVLSIPGLKYDLVTPNQGFVYDSETKSLYVSFWGGPVYKTSVADFGSWEELITERENYMAGHIDIMRSLRSKKLITGSEFYWDPKNESFTPVYSYTIANTSATKLPILK